MAGSEIMANRFIDDFIPRVSRTFALTIKFLPRGLRNSVYSSYLLCRVADTLEDSPFLSESDKSIRLFKLRDLLLSASTGFPVNTGGISALYDEVGGIEQDDHKLLAESAKLFEILETLPESHKRIIYRWVAEMAGGMAEYAGFGGKADNSVTALRDVGDWDRYCYFVAGTVGHMITELFIIQYDFDSVISENLKRLGKSFGLGLQKVNVIKDFPVDRERGVCYLPGDLLTKRGIEPGRLQPETDSAKIIEFVNEIIELTVPHLDDAMEYSAHIPRHLTGVRMFLVLPVYLAIETLHLIETEAVRTLTGPPVKLTRAAVSRLVGAAGIRIGSNKKLYDYYRGIREKVLK